MWAPWQTQRAFVHKFILSLLCLPSSAMPGRFSTMFMSTIDRPKATLAGPIYHQLVILVQCYRSVIWKYGAEVDRSATASRKVTKMHAFIFVFMMSRRGWGRRSGGGGWRKRGWKSTPKWTKSWSYCLMSGSYCRNSDAGFFKSKKGVEKGVKPLADLDANMCNYS